MVKKIPAGERRTAGQLRQAYEIEKELASRLRHADRSRRKEEYRAAYDEWYERVFRDKQLRPGDAVSRKTSVREQKMLLARFLRPQSRFLEIGPGDCSLSVEIAEQVKEVYAVDVSGRAAEGVRLPANCTFILSDGCGVPLPPGSVDMAYSNQVLEHLHPEDAGEQVRDVCNALVPGGMYLCVTPNRLYGPHDISGYFDEVATGFHIREYTVTELVCIFRKAGFSRSRLLIGAKGRYIAVPAWPVRLVEALLDRLPRGLGRSLASLPPFKLVLGIKLLAVK
ncbi:MAG: class I SAM-dependent methyltransferase [Nitrospirae bacterium]|nr:class I SAM-dependent methyltransferase [Nitrospirota bacterium]